MSNTALVPVDYSQLPSTQIGSHDELTALAKSADFISRLQLFTKGKAIDKGLVRPGNYGIPESDEEIEDLGSMIDVIPFARKPKAIDFSDKEAILVSHDVKSDLFIRTQAKAQEKESNCMYGPSFLMFERSTGRFLELFCGSKSMRGEAKKIYPFLQLTQAEIDERNLVGGEPHGPLPLTLKSRLVERGSYSWHVPVISKCSVPFDNLPSFEVVAAEVQRFLTTKQEVEPAKDDGKKQRAR